MSKKMLINATLAEENRVAIVEDGVLSELDIEVAGREQTKGNIYKAVVVRVETGLQAAFVDYGAERLGFLQIDEINFKTVRPDYKSQDGRGRPRITDLLSRGQEILVQIIKEERGTKGAALTTYLSLAGRYMVLMPDSSTRGVSRKAENDAQRKQLKKAMASLELPEKFGYIVRTAALDQTREELERDSRYLIRLYENICELQKNTKAPALIYRESNLVIRSIRDYFTTDMDEVLIDDPEVFGEAKDFFKMLMPDHMGLVKLHQERRPIFSRYQIEEQIETISSNKINLPSGGSIVIDSTEALVAIDINSGKMASEQSVEETATKTNLEAAAEIGRQLRLRDLGGLIVIDFIDMRERKNIRAVEQQLKKSTERDKARINIGRISQFGLLEMSRQRIKATLAAATYRTCPHCHGLGRIKSPEALAVNLLRRIHTGVAKGQIGKVDAQLPLDVASYLLNNKRDELHEMERRYRVQIHIHGHPDFLTDQVEIDFQKREKSPEPQNELVTVGMLQTLAEESPVDQLASTPPIDKPSTDDLQTKETQGGEAETGTAATPAKKRRRRRSRKKSVDTPAVETTATESEQSGESLTAESAADSAQPQEAAAAMTEVADVPAQNETESVPAPLAETEPKPKRPRRRRSRKKPEGAPATEPAGVDMSASAEPAVVSSDIVDSHVSEEAAKPVTPPADAEVKPKRPRQRRSRKKADESPDTKPTKSDTDQVETPPGSANEASSSLQITTNELSDSTETLSAQALPTENIPKKPSSRRSRSRKPATKLKTESSAQPVSTPSASANTAAVVTTNEVSPAADTTNPPQKPKRATRVRPRNPAAKKPDHTANPSTDPSVKTAKVETEVAPTENKPKPRRRTPRKKKETTVTE